jgi:hypothetical protein
MQINRFRTRAAANTEHLHPRPSVASSRNDDARRTRLEALVATDKPMDDDQLAYVLGADRHHINSVCRKLKSEGRVRRARLIKYLVMLT